MVLDQGIYPSQRLPTRYEHGITVLFSERSELLGFLVYLRFDLRSQLFQMLNLGLFEMLLIC